MSIYNECMLCPRKCCVDRSKSMGFCRQSDNLRIARADLHFWEEPCISGKNGSGTVFFSGCTLKCCFCQNYEVSQENKGYYISAVELADIFLELQHKGAHNINLVSPTPHVPKIIEALDIARPRLIIPVVYNCGGYENVDTIKMLDGYVNVYLPDMKYFNDEYALKYSGTKNYFSEAIASLKEMVRQVGKPQFDDKGIIKKGVIVRHLVLPTLRKDSIAVINELAKSFKSDEILLSIMSQYVPMHKSFEFKELSRRVSTFEYNSVLDEASKFGFNGFSQEREAADKSYIPEFSGRKEYG
ncbi:MAG: radical SAM protein [Oscillospiraceae bacterium]|nr:radical SAM protein [Oscillospiraceae bacterium]